ncbi:MAG: Aminopeptidase N [Chlorobi bacterium OLB5]|nr:MAG: Aminopeptidase N [Chlorobi bacterium OLB5]
MKRILFTSILTLLLNNFISAQWIEQQSGVTSQLNAVSSPAPPVFNQGWICGNNGVVLRTTNNGNNWANVSSGIPVNIDLFSIRAVNSQMVFTSGKNPSGTSFIFRTTNSGLNWSVVHTQTNITNYGFAEIYGTYYLIASPLNSRWQIWRSTNSGVSWDSAGLYLPQSGSETGFINSVYSLEEKIWFGTNNSRIYRSFWGGNWQALSTVPLVNSRSVVFQYLLTEAVGSGICGDINIIKSTNLGSNWLPLNTAGNGFVSGTACHPGLIGKFWYTKNQFIYTNSASDTFALQYTAPAGNYTHIGANYLGSAAVWAVRDNGGISKYTGEIGIQTISTEIPELFSLSQNYPNPFNPSTIIRFQIPLLSTTPLGRGVSGEAGRGVFTLLKVYDILGNDITTLLNQQLSPGTYSIDWDGSNYPSGLYFYTLRSGDYTETKKMILLK